MGEELTRGYDAEAADYSRTHPAFKGRLQFDLTFELLGKRVTRKARADYKYTPDWPTTIATRRRRSSAGRDRL